MHLSDWFHLTELEAGKGKGISLFLPIPGLCEPSPGSAGVRPIPKPSFFYLSLYFISAVPEVQHHGGFIWIMSPETSDPIAGVARALSCTQSNISRSGRSVFRPLFFSFFIYNGVYVCPC